MVHRKRLAIRATLPSGISAAARDVSSIVSSRRRGIATLEFALVMPVLLFLFLLIFSFANTHIGRSSSIVASKNKAWKARFGDQGNLEPENVLGFDPASTLNPESRPGIARGTHETRVRTAWFLGSTNRTAKTKHTVLGGAYDHRNLRFDEGQPLVPGVRFNTFARAGGGASFFRSGMPTAAVRDTLEQLWSTANGMRESVEDILGAAKALVKAPNLSDLNPLDNPRFKAAKKLLSGIEGVFDSVKSMPQMVNSVRNLSGDLPIPLNELSSLAVPNLSLGSPADFLDSIGSISKMISNIGEMSSLANQAQGYYQHIGKMY